MKQFLGILLISTAVTWLNAELNVGDNTTTACASQKLGSCPPAVINPSIFSCTKHFQCRGNRLCCASNGVLVCSDPPGSKSMKCPNSITQKKTPCLVDFNCDDRSKCCFDDSSCASYCTMPEATEDPDSSVNEMKKDINCPSVSNGNVQCIESKSCPRNQLCCPNKSGGKSCTDPQSIIPGNCPSPLNIPGAETNKPCAADNDCNEELYTGMKCCRLNDANYKCAYPDHGGSVTTTPSPVTNPTPPPITNPTPPPVTNPTPPPVTNPTPPPITNPTPSTSILTSSTNNPVYPPGFPVPAPVCPIRFQMHPLFQQCPSSSLFLCQDPCPGNQICCQDSRGTKYCRLPRALKPGNCPTSDRVIRKQSIDCFFDTNCKGSKKCCGGGGCLFYNCVSPDKY